MANIRNGIGKQPSRASVPKGGKGLVGKKQSGTIMPTKSVGTRRVAY